MFDYHVHTSLSADSRMPVRDACRAAAALGIREIAFTEHLDCFYPGSDLSWRFDPDEYHAAVEEARAAWGPQLEVVKGIEVGLHRAAYEEARLFTGCQDFDFVIGSLHIVEDLDMDNGDYFAGKTLKESLRVYFETLYGHVNDYLEFNVLGHLDLVKRYVRHLGCTATESDIRASFEVIEAILLKLIHSGRGIELNMSHTRYGLAEPHPGFSVLKMYRELGGEIITVGSDAHSPPYVGVGIAAGHDLLVQAGYKYVTTFRKRRPDFILLDKIRPV